ncbi:hypothetical protein ACFQ4A_08490 [Lentibacillus salinarum]|uniref:Uncharacterized protein n=1 Tax=Lentibacillus salinarum TaxID=446820 RepID=A0ABW3ZV73_9BACI
MSFQMQRSEVGLKEIGELAISVLKTSSKIFLKILCSQKTAEIPNSL